MGSDPSPCPWQREGGVQTSAPPDRLAGQKSPPITGETQRDPRNGGFEDFSLGQEGGGEGVPGTGAVPSRGHPSRGIPSCICCAPPRPWRRPAPLPTAPAQGGQPWPDGEGGCGPRLPDPMAGGEPPSSSPIRKPPPPQCPGNVSGERALPVPPASWFFFFATSFWYVLRILRRAQTPPKEV